MRSEFFLGYLQTPTRASPGVRGEGGSETYTPKIWYIRLSFVVYRSQPPFPSKAPSATPLLGSEGILKGKLISFLKSLLLKTPDLIYPIIFCCIGICHSPPAPPPSSTGDALVGGFLKGKMSSFLNSPPFKTLELMYHMIFCSVFRFLPLRRRRMRRTKRKNRHF